MTATQVAIAPNNCPVGKPYSTATVLVTPQIAKHWLDNYNVSNRPLLKSNVAAYARAIREGRWKLNGETVKFASTGRLMDGQNRLTAVVETGVAVPMLVVYGLEEESFATIDIGSGRTGGQIFHCDGEQNANALHAACKNCCLWEAGMPFVAIKVTADEAKAFLHKNPEIRRVVREVHHGLLRSSVAACLKWYMERIDRSAADDFFERARTGIQLTEGSPLLALRRVVHEDVARHRRRSQREQAAMTIKAWNAWRRGQSIRNLVWREDEKFPELM